MRHPNQTTGHLAGRGFTDHQIAESRSWWIVPVSREAFSALARAEFPRMRGSKHGRMVTGDGTALYPPSRKSTE